MNLSPETDSIAFAFNTGELWSIDTSVLRMAAKKRHLYFLDIARTLVPKLREYGQFLRSLGIQPPFKWIAGLEGVKGWRLQVPPPPNHISTSPGDTCFRDVVEADGTYDPAQPPAMAGCYCSSLSFSEGAARRYPTPHREGSSSLPMEISDSSPADATYGTLSSPCADKPARH